jgi:hypothetical protein
MGLHHIREEYIMKYIYISINLVNQTLYDKQVVVKDDNRNHIVIFSDTITQGDTVPLSVATSQAGYGDIHYSVDGGVFIGSPLLSPDFDVSV